LVALEAVVIANGTEQGYEIAGAELVDLVEHVCTSPTAECIYGFEALATPMPAPPAPIAHRDPRYTG
jgi:hypothetical protein